MDSLKPLSKSVAQEVDKQLVEVFKIADAVEKAYKEFLNASDRLAAALGMDKDRILVHTLPRQSPISRREEHRIKKWVESKKTGLTERLIFMAKEKAERENRKKVLSEMNISNVDKNLLLKIFGLND